MSFCGDCRYWQFESNPQFQSPEEQDGFGLCDRFQQMKANPTRALARSDDEYARLQTRNEFGCVLFEGR